MITFGILFALNIAVGLVALAFFIVGLGDGTITTMNILIWAMLLSVVFTLPWAAWLVRVRGRPRLATAMLVPLAVLMVVGGAIMAILIVNPPDFR